MSPPVPPRSWRTLPAALAWLALALVLVLMPGGTWAQDRQGVELRDDRASIDAWSSVQLLPDPAGHWHVDEILRMNGRFAAPDGPRANLGIVRHPVWVRIPVNVPATESGRWLLHIDFPALDRIDVHVVTDGRVVRHAVLGDHLVYADRPHATRAHALPLALEPGQAHELLLRVQTTGSMLLPVRFVKPEQLAQEEAPFQLVQGITVGLGLCLVVFSLGYWKTQRDSSYLSYAVSMLSITAFFMTYHGLGSQHLWPTQEWLTRNTAPLTVLIALAAGIHFLERVLAVHEVSPLLARLMRGTALLCVALSAAFVVDLIGYPVAQVASTLLGPTPILLGLPAAYLRARRGDRVAQYVLAGWCLYSVGIATAAGLLRGLLPLNFFTEHALQAGSMIEMVVWLLVLGVRHEELRRQLERGLREREALRQLAHTDALTGLPNRRGLEIEIGRALQRVDERRLLGVFMLDLDGFKAVNDRFGHDAGDELLRIVAQRLRSVLRTGDTVARIGGDEFVVVVSGIDTEVSARSVGYKLLQAIEEPILVGGHHCPVSVTVGYALAPEDGQDETVLLKIADAAMYAGKQSGKQCVVRGREPSAQGAPSLAPVAEPEGRGPMARSHAEGQPFNTAAPEAADPILTLDEGDSLAPPLGGRQSRDKTTT